LKIEIKNHTPFRTFYSWNSYSLFSFLFIIQTLDYEIKCETNGSYCKA